MSVYLTNANEIEAIFTPPKGGPKTNVIEHHKVPYFDILLFFCVT